MELVSQHQDNLAFDSRERNVLGDITEFSDEQVSVNLLGSIWGLRERIAEAKVYDAMQQTNEVVFSDDIYANNASESEPGLVQLDNGCYFNYFTSSSSFVLIDYLDQNFDKVDLDKDGVMSRDELGAILNDCSLPDKAREAISLLTKRLESFQSLVNDSTDGISKLDMDEFERLFDVYIDKVLNGGEIDESLQFIDEFERILTLE